MIEGYTDNGPVLINPRHVVSVYAGGEQGYGFWCNMVMVDGTIHRFKGSTASKVYVDLLAFDRQQERSDG